MEIQKMTETISVVVVDDHPLMHEAVRSMISKRPDLELVGEGTCGDDAFTLVETHKPNILIIDLSMPQSSSKGESSARFQLLPAVSRLAKENPDTSVIVLTQHFVPVLVTGGIERGVRGYILKSDSLSLNLAEAIDTIMKGGVYLSETISGHLLRKQKGQPAELTERRLEALALIAATPGLPYSKHASDLKISESTFRNHLTKVYRALGVNNVTAAVIRAKEVGLIP
jgi:DNA-binding NarL/FixJ family response regulator